MPTAANLFGSILFGIVGMSALGYGKKARQLNPMLLGGALMTFPYFVTQTWLIYGVGLVLTGLLFRFPE
jgi:hypothetical protein